MPTCAPVTRDELLANWVLLPDSVTGSLRTLIAGADYAVRPYSVSGSTGLVGAYDAGAGVSGAWPGLGVNETVDLTTAEVFVLDALVRYHSETGAVSAAKGVQYGTVPNQIRHNGGATIWTGSGYTVGLGIPVAIGDWVRLDNNGATILYTRVRDFVYLSGSPTVLVLDDNLPAALTGGAYFNVSLAQVVPEVELSAGDVTLTSSTVGADAGIVLSTDRTGVTTYPLIGNTGYSAVYTSYRALRTTLVSDGVISVSTAAELATYFTGDYTSPDSGLAFAVLRALAPAQTPALAEPPAVLFVAVASDLVADWTAVVSRVIRRRDWYTVAPLTIDPTRIDLWVDAVDTRASIGLYSRVDVALELITEETILSGSGNTVTVNQSSTPGFDRTVIRDGGVASPFADVEAGDLIDLNGTTYTVASVLSAQTLTLTASAAAGTLIPLVSIIHPMTTAEQVTNYGARAAAYDSRAVSVVFPPNPTWNDEVVDGFLFAAMTAGLRGYTIPQQSLKGVAAESGWGVPQSTYEFLGELEDLGDQGCFVWEDCEALPGTPVVLYANTTDQSSVLNGREALVADEDAIRRYLLDVVSCYQGRFKVTQATLNDMRQQVIEAISFLLTTTAVQNFGAILVSGQVGQPYADPNQLDHVIVPVAVQISTVIDSVTVEIQVTVQSISG